MSEGATAGTNNSRRRGGRLGVLAVFDQCLYSGTNFLTAVLIGRWAGASELGTYTLAISITVLMMSLQRSLLIAPFVVIRSGLDESEKTSMRNTIVSIALGLVFVSSLMCLIAGTLSKHQVLLALSVAIGGGLLRDFVRRMAISDYQYNRVIAVDGLVAVLQLGGLLWIAKLNASNIELTASMALAWCGLVWSMVATFFLGGLIRSTKNRSEEKSESVDAIEAGTNPQSNNQLRKHAFSTTENFKTLWPTGRWISLTQVISTLQAYAMPWVLAVAHSMELAGVYAACWTMVQVVSPAIEGVCNLLEPGLASAAAQPTMASFHRLMRNVTVLFSILMGALVIAAIFFGDQLLALSYGKEFASHQSVLVLLTVAAAVGNTSIPANKALIQLGWASANSFIAGIALVLTVVSAFLCLRWIGPEGAAWGLLIGTTFGFLTRWWLLRKAVAHD